MRASAARLACGVRSRYDALLACGALEPDAAQLAVVARLSRLHGELVTHSSAGGWFAGLLSPAAAVSEGVDAAALARRVDAELGPPPAPPVPPRGLFIYGGVGVGKTRLMDLFHDAAAEALGPSATRRVHFNAFSLRVHEALHRLSPAGAGAQQASDARAALLAARRRRSQAAAGAAAGGASVSNAAVFGDVAEAVLPDAASGVLCFDEFEVRDAFTAVALKGVLEALLARGVAIVMTSNRAPTGMSAGAAQQRELYDAFAATLASRCEAVAVETRRDYRAVAAEAAPLQLAMPRGDARMDALHAACVAAAGGGAAPAPEDVRVAFGRSLRVPLAAGAVARASFDALCAAPVGAADYIALADRFPALFLDDVPQLSSSAADAARRFITLVDELYNARCVLAHTAAAPPGALFAGAGDDVALVDLEALQFEGEAEGARSRRDVARHAGVAPVAATPAAMAGAVAALSGEAERFAFARAASRLAEMNTADWVRRSRAPQALRDALLAAH